MTRLRLPVAESGATLVRVNEEKVATGRCVRLREAEPPNADRSAWPDLVLKPELFDLVTDLPDGIGYLGRAESWVQCTAAAEWDAAQANCLPLERAENRSGEVVVVLAPLTAAGYAAQRARLVAQADEKERAAAQVAEKRPPTARTLSRKRETSLGLTLPERLMDALAVDTADYQRYGWNRPPAACEIRYQRATLSPLARRNINGRSMTRNHHRSTVARYLLAGRPQPRIEDAVRIGELMRLAALARFGWQTDPHTGRRVAQAPPEISGREATGGPLRDPGHAHAFWLPEDADGDGKIDHVCVYAAAGFDTRVRSALDRLTRLWVRTGAATAGNGNEEGGRREWRLALEGFGSCAEFAGVSALFGSAGIWHSATPFLPTAHLKRSGDGRQARHLLERDEIVAGTLAEATGYPREVRRLLQRRGMLKESLAEHLQVAILPHVIVHGAPRRALQFHRFRSRGREKATDAHGALLQLRFPEPIAGPVALGYGCHFGLGLFATSGLMHTRKWNEDSRG